MARKMTQGMFFLSDYPEPLRPQHLDWLKLLHKPQSLPHLECCPTEALAQELVVAVREAKEVGEWYVETDGASHDQVAEVLWGSERNAFVAALEQAIENITDPLAHQKVCHHLSTLIWTETLIEGGEGWGKGGNSTHELWLHDSALSWLSCPDFSENVV